MAGLNAPVCVQLRPAASVASPPRDITDQIAPPRYSTSDPGGFQAATIPLQRPLVGQGRELEAGATVRITHALHGGVLWEGDLQDPNRGGGPSGPVWELTALGRSASLKDNESPYVGIDSSLTSWTAAPLVTSTHPQATVQMQVQGDVGAAMAFTMPPGVVRPFGASVMAQARYLGFVTTGQDLGTVTCLARAQYTSAAHEQTLGVPGSPNLVTTTWIGTATTTLAIDSTTHGPFFPAVPQINWDLTLATSPYTTTDDDSCYFGTIAVRPLIKDKNGTTVAANTYTKSYARAHEVIGDLIGGGRLPMIDGAKSVISTGSTYQFKQLAWPDGVTDDQILAELMNAEYAYTWFVWENGGLLWTARSTAVRYEVDADVDSISFSGSQAEIYNAVKVRYKDEFGDTQTATQTQTVPSLGARLVTKLLDLSDNTAVTFDEAYAIAGAFLADHRYPIRGGTATVGRPIFDRKFGRWVDPCEVRAGALVAVRNIAPSVAALVPPAPNGLTCFRLARTEYDAGQSAVSLELGQPARSVERLIAETRRSLDTRRRA